MTKLDSVLDAAGSFYHTTNDIVGDGIVFGFKHKASLNDAFRASKNENKENHFLITKDVKQKTLKIAKR